MKHILNKRNGKVKQMRLMTVLLVPAVALILGVTSPNCLADEIEFAETEIFFEFNSTDLDLGIQIFFDAEGWEEVEVEDPEGKTIFDVENGKGLKEIGSTEVFTESAEPELEGTLAQAIAEFQAKFPKGTYTFMGKAVEGDKLVGEADLAYELPTAPIITGPGALPGPGNNPYVIEWTQPGGGPEIIGYEVVAELVIEVDGDEHTLVNTGMFLAGATEFTVSAEFVDQIQDAEDAEELVEFKVEVIARAVNLNKTITESVIFEDLEE